MQDLDATWAVRAATPADTARVDALLARSYPKLLRPDYPPSLLVTAVPLIARARPELMACGTYFVAETPGGDVVGAGGYTPKPRREGWHDMRHLVTDDRHLRRGIARSLVERIFADLRARAPARLDCLATRTAVPFYLAMGFTALGPVDVPLSRGLVFPAIQMQRSV
jgi:GNAT superfamily N-acetyltransferase